MGMSKDPVLLSFPFPFHHPRGTGFSILGDGKKAGSHGTTIHSARDAAPVGGAALLRVGDAVSQTRQGLREVARNSGGAALRRLRLPFPPPGHRRARVRSVTRSRPSARVPMACRTEGPLPVRG